MSRMRHKVNFKAEFSWFESRLFNLRSVSFTKVKQCSSTHYLSISGGKIIEFIPFPRVIGLCEMQIASFGIWTWVAVSISYDGNHFPMNASDACDTIRYNNISLEIARSVSLHFEINKIFGTRSVENRWFFTCTNLCYTKHCCSNSNETGVI